MISTKRNLSTHDHTCPYCSRVWTHEGPEANMCWVSDGDDRICPQCEFEQGEAVTTRHQRQRREDA